MTDDKVGSLKGWGCTYLDKDDCIKLNCCEIFKNVTVICFRGRKLSLKWIQIEQNANII